MAQPPKIKVPRPLVEMDGDEMTRVVWKMIRDRFILPYLDIDIRYFDLSLGNRDDTADQVTVEAAQALMEYGVGVKCPTISVDQARMKEFGLKQSMSLHSHIYLIQAYLPWVCNSVVLSQRHHSKHGRRHTLQRTYHHSTHSSPGSSVEGAHHRRSPCFRRDLPL